jgi:DNA-binding winged helix-turn-helix (wHTH) protein
LSESTHLGIGDWTASPALNLLERGDESVKLEPRAMDVLVYLAEHADEVVSVNELMDGVWAGVVVGDGSVYLAISQEEVLLQSPSRCLWSYVESARVILLWIMRC